jgi:carbonic anhydrase
VQKPGRLSQHAERRILTSAEGQSPLVAVLACSDSRVSLEIIFDTPLGDIFTVRNNGNIVGGNEIASMEYAVLHLGVQDLIVMGHTQCGAIAAAVHGKEFHSTGAMMWKGIEQVTEKILRDQPELEGADFIEAVSRANVWQSVADLLEQSRELSDSVMRGRLRILGAYYDMRKGVVDFMGQHPDQEAIIGCKSS